MDNKTVKDRFEGCLLGGAAGDALGYAVEFSWEDDIFSRFGPDGIQTLEQAAQHGFGEVAHFSDDTQMTLFTAEGLTHRMDAHGGAPNASDIWLAYREWLGTQGDTSRMDDPKNPRMNLYSVGALHELRAPGHTCLSAIRESPEGGTLQSPVNNSKGCGGVMRVAPIGLLASMFDEVDPFVLGAQAAALTHGHPLGWLPAAALAGIVTLLCCAEDTDGESPRDTLVAIIRSAANIVARHFSDWDEAQELRDRIHHAVDLALNHGDRDDLSCIHELGEGWVGDEALLIAVYAAVAHTDDFSAALTCAANHKGDSDSTAAVAGNILGALVGRTALERSFDLVLLEEKDLLASVADDLLAHALSASGLPEGPDAYISILRIDNPPAPAEREQPAALPVDQGMPYTPLTKRALLLSFEAHKEQLDKSGLPYVYHPFHLAEQMKTEEAACVALLHDVVEDGHLTFAQLREAGMPDAVVEGVAALTHDAKVPYMEYVLRLRTNPLAREVKLADLRHNANLDRLDEPTPKDHRRRQRYLIAQALLSDDADFYDGKEQPAVWHKPISLLGDDASLVVTYSEEGRVLRFTVVAEGRRVTFSAADASALREELNPSVSLAEALSDALERGMEGVIQTLDRLGISHS